MLGINFTISSSKFSLIVLTIDSRCSCEIDIMRLEETNNEDLISERSCIDEIGFVQDCG